MSEDGAYGAPSGPSSDHVVVSGRPREAERVRLEAMAPGYLDRVRAGARRLAHRSGPLIDVTLALADVEELAAIDLDVPTLSRLRVGRWVKVGVKRLTTWYLRYLVQQVSAFGASVARLGTLLVARTDRIEERTSVLAADLERLRSRVERLEGRAGPDADPAERPA